MMQMQRDLMVAAQIGLGAPIDIGAAVKLPSFNVNPYVLIRQVWAQAQGRSWDQAFTAANARADAKKWVASDNTSREDFITLLVSTAINVKLVKDKNISAGGSDNPADTLSRTLDIIAKRRGITAPTPAQATQMKNNAAGNIEIAIPLEIIVALIGSLIVAGITVALIYFASQVIDDVLSKIECDRELVRLHADYNKIVDYHIANPNAPWSSDDLKARDDLLAAQAFVAGGCTKKAPGPESWVPWIVGGVAIAGITSVAIVYRDDIKAWFASRRARA